MKILVVDDSRTMRTIVIRTLRKAGFGDHEMVEAANGKDALKQINSSAPDLVLCDWNMPEMSGLELLKTLRSDGCEINFGFITTESSKEMHDRATEAGALFFISKPFTADILEDTLSPLVG